MAELRTLKPGWLHWPNDPGSESCCGLCGCNRSGSPDEPNARNEACEDGACRCHVETIIDRREASDMLRQVAYKGIDKAAHTR